MGRFGVLAAGLTQGDWLLLGALADGGVLGSFRVDQVLGRSFKGKQELALSRKGVQASKMNQYYPILKYLMLLVSLDTLFHHSYMCPFSCFFQTLLGQPPFELGARSSAALFVPSATKQAGQEGTVRCSKELLTS